MSQHILARHGSYPACDTKVLTVLIQVVKTLVHVIMPDILSNWGLEISPLLSKEDKHQIGLWSSAPQKNKEERGKKKRGMSVKNYDWKEKMGVL